MSTTFIIPSVKVATYPDGELAQELDNDQYTKIARRSNGTIQWLNGMEILNKYIDDKVKVYPINNSPQGIYTIGDIKNEINNEKVNQ
jgi:hypothetical protein